MKHRGLGFVFQPQYRDKFGVLRTTSTWWVGYSVHGKAFRENAHTEKRAEAVRFLKQKIADAGSGKPVGAQVERTTLDDLITMVEADYKANGHTSLNRVQAAAAHLREYYGGERKARDITDDTVTAYAAHRLEEGAAPSTVNCELAVLLRGFRLGKKKVPLIPEIKKLRVSNTRKGYFEADQFRAVLQYLPAHLVPFAHAAYITGWRRGELLSRMWKHVDLGKGWLKLEPGETKNDEGREFPFTPELRAVLEGQLGRVREIEKATGQIVPWVFCLPSGARVGDFRKAWARACRLAGVPGHLVHDFRRTAVRNLERAGVSRSAAMKMTGHKTEAVYRRYAITDSVMLQEAAAKLSALHAAETNSKSLVKVTELSTRRDAAAL
jgi:integrase